MGVPLEIPWGQVSDLKAESWGNLPTLVTFTPRHPTQLENPTEIPWSFCKGGDGVE